MEPEIGKVGNKKPYVCPGCQSVNFHLGLTESEELEERILTIDCSQCDEGYFAFPIPEHFEKYIEKFYLERELGRE